MTANGPYTKENIWKNLSTDDKVLYWALLNMLRMQTPDEQVELRTTHVNSRGFNSADAAFGTSLAQQYQVRKSLSQKQKDMARKMLRKYCGQLADIANENWARKQREMGLQKNPTEDSKVTIVRSKPSSFDFRYNRRQPSNYDILVGGRIVGKILGSLTRMYETTDWGVYVIDENGNLREVKYVYGKRGVRGFDVAKRFAIEYWGNRNPLFSGRSSSQSLYESFHGNPSKGTRKVKVNVPEPGDTLVKIGRLTELRYRPEEPSQHTGTEFYHKMGDTGRMVLRNKPILATGPDGKGLFIIDDKASPKFTDRGIIG